MSPVTNVPRHRSQVPAPVKSYIVPSLSTDLWEGSLPAPAICHSSDSCMVVYRHVGRDVRAAGGVSIDAAQPVGGVTLTLRHRQSKQCIRFTVQASRKILVVVQLQGRSFCSLLRCPPLQVKPGQAYLAKNRGDCRRPRHCQMS